MSSYGFVQVILKHNYETSGLNGALEMIYLIKQMRKQAQRETDLPKIVNIRLNPRSADSQSYVFPTKLFMHSCYFCKFALTILVD